MTDDTRARLLEAYPPHLVDRIFAFRARGDDLSGRRERLIAASEEMDSKMWERAFEQLERESGEYGAEGEQLKKDMEAWLNRDETR